MREDAPQNLRYAVVTIAYEAGLTPSSLRTIVCGMLRVPADETNWSEYPNVEYEVRTHVGEMPWYRVYDLAELIYERLREGLGRGDFDLFTKELNAFFRENGIGWQLIDGHIQVRGDAAFEAVVGNALTSLASSAYRTAESELQEARADLSRRPNPDLTGAVHHAMGALEALSRELTGKPQLTFGQLLPSLHSIPKPLDTALDKMWGFASESARHVREGATPKFAEAELIVGTCGTVITYLLEKSK